jgi:sodium/hydrogen antiporter
VDERLVAAMAGLLFVWAIISGPLARRNITGPLVFAAAGYLIGNPDWGALPVDVAAESVHVIAEVTLALVLFSDAVRVNIRELRRDIALPARLLGIGLPLSVIAGAIVASLLLGLPWALGGFVGAALAPTDAALSAQVINDERIPLRIRRALNVESGLNDGIATPIVTVTLAIAAAQIGAVGESASFEFGSALRELAVGLVVGVGVGTGGAALLTLAARNGWIVAGGRRLAMLALALGAFSVALALDGNGFIAAFVAGVAVGARLRQDVVPVERAAELPELGGELLALVVWFLFGATLVPIALAHVDPRVIIYALLSLTLVRMAPVGLSLLGARIDAPTATFIGWFGPRGLASVVFALIAIEELGEGSSDASVAVATVALTVALSVLLHGVTAGPGGRRYLSRESVEKERPAGSGSTAPRARPSGFMRRRTSADPT